MPYNGPTSGPFVDGTFPRVSFIHTKPNTSVHIINKIYLMTKQIKKLQKIQKEIRLGNEIILGQLLEITRQHGRVQHKDFSL